MSSRADWGYWDFVEAGVPIPQPFGEGWSDYCKVKQKAAAEYVARNPRHTLQPASVTSGRCLACGGLMPVGKRGHAKTCSPRCRKAYSRGVIVQLEDIDNTEMD